MNDCVHNEECRVCCGKNLELVLDLGETPPANAYLSKAGFRKPEQRFPLAVYFCNDCSLLQLLDVVNPEVLFKNYHFLTGASQPSVEHFQQYANKAIMPFIESSDDLVIDIGGNDGVLLSYVKERARVLNVDPADNLAPLSEEKGVPFYPAFFTSETAEDILGKFGLARVVTANNVFAHTDPIRDVFKGVARLIGEDGVFIFEVHWVKHLLDERAFDQIYHEHLCYYSLHALKHLTESAGMRIFNVEVVPTQGKSLRVYASRSRLVSPEVEKILEQEREAGLTILETFRAFAKEVEQNKEKLPALLRELKKEGKSIVGYGAPAKGNTLLNYYSVDHSMLDYIVDTTPFKQGLHTPGTHIPISSPERLRQLPPDYVLILAWNYTSYILEQEKDLRARGVQFIMPIPTPRIV